MAMRATLCFPPAAHAGAAIRLARHCAFALVATAWPALVAADANPPPPAQWLLLNGHVITLNAGDQIAQAIGVAGQRIVAVGTNAEVERHAATDARRIDLKGLTVTPGLIDAHVHFAWGGANRHIVLDLSYPTVQRITDIQRLLTERAARLPRGAWIEAAGWDEAKLLPSRTLRAADLDPHTGSRPAWLKHATGHYGVANSAALRLAEITEDTDDPPGGQIERDAHRRPTGLLKESAQELVQQLLPERSQLDYEQGIEQLAREFNAECMTGAKDPGITEVEWEAYQAVLRRGKLPVRVFALWKSGTTERAARELIARHAATSRPYESSGDARLVSGGVKIFMDGSGTARTGWMHEDWHHHGRPEIDNKGYPAADPDTLRTLIGTYHEAGMHVATHAIGDHAIDWTVDSYAQALQNKPTRGLRHAVVHANIPSARAISTMAELQRAYDAAYPEPSAAFTWWLGDAYADAFGEVRSKRLNPFATYIKNGITWANGSDFPVTPYAARHGIWSSVARRTLLSPSKDPFGRAEAVDVKVALRSSTIWAARQMFLEDKVGTIEVGKLADLAIWDRDFYAVNTDQLQTVRCLMTVLEGAVVYRAEDGPSEDTANTPKLPGTP